MAGLLALIASVAALDSLNPSTVGPALALAVGGHPRRDVASFTAGVFAVSTAGGLVLLFGPGRGLLASIAKPTPHTQHLVEIASGGALLAAAVVLWSLRRRIGHRLSAAQRSSGRSALALGAGIMAVELPTAFPYFAGLLATVTSRHGAGTESALVLLYNVIFVAPLLLVLGLVAAGGSSAAPALRRVGRLLDAYAPALVPVTLGAIGVALLAIGGAGL